MNTIDLLRCDLQNREWIDGHLEQLNRDYKGSYIVVHNKGVLAVGLSIPALRTAIKQSMIPIDEVTMQYLPEEPGAMILCDTLKS